MSRCVVVAGGTYGIGRAVSYAFAQSGDQVFAIGIDAGQQEQFITSAKTSGLDVNALLGDISDPGSVDRMVSEVGARRDNIDVLVNCAAIATIGTILDTDVEMWDRAFAVNVRGMFLMCKACIPRMAAGSSIINLTSGAGYGLPGPAPGIAYSASKGTVVPFTRTLALDLAAQHIRVNAVLPGATYPTAGNEHLARDAADELGRNINVQGRWNTPDDIAAAVFWLASDAAEVVSGITLEVGTLPRHASLGGGAGAAALGKTLPPDRRKRFVHPQSYVDGGDG